jgi:DNA polymerase bacteriophage-type
MAEPFFVDTECRNAVPIQRGDDAYTRTAECTIVTFARGEKPVQLWDLFDSPQMPAELEDNLDDDRVMKVAHRAKFDRAIIQHSLKKVTPVESWFCTQCCAYSHGLPGSLETLGLVLGLAPDQAKLAEDGKNVGAWFWSPKADGEFRSPYDYPDKWRTFCNYAVRDTEALREVFRKLAKHNYTGSNFELYHVGEHINHRGFGFDRQLALAAQGFLKSAKVSTDAALAKATDGAVAAATQRQRLLNYLNNKLGADIANLRASEIRDYLEQDDLNPEVRFLLETRLEAAKSSGSKYSRGLVMVGPGSRMRHTIQHNGAGRTGRYSHRGFQPGNMSRPALTVRRPNGEYEQIPVKAKFIDEVVIPGIYSGQAANNPLVYGGPNEAAALALRHVITAACGNELVVADFSNIESRILAWIADQTWKLEAYRSGADLYKLLCANSLNISLDSVNDNQRQAFKVVELACGFGGGVGALVTMAAAYQMDLDAIADVMMPLATPKQLKKAHKAWRRAFLTNEDYALNAKTYMACDVLKQAYRESNDAINQFRYDLDNAIKGAIKSPGQSYSVGRCKVWSVGTWLIIELPSGRRLLYASPKVHTEVVADVENGKPIHREYVSYCTARGKSWRREKAWAGLFVENIVQAIAADCLRGAIMRLHRDTLTVPTIAAYLDTLPPEERSAISLHVHDELVLDVPKGCYTLERMIQVITAPFDWSDGLPLAAAGWVNFRYGKR